jgi:DNA-binding MarR family transcriptional regulator
MGEYPRPVAESERDVGGDGIRQRMESVAEQAAHIGATLKEILDSTKEQVASENRWHEPATIMAVKAQQVRSTIKSRRLREDVFGDENLFGEPAWDMLLDLYASHLEQKRVSVSSLQIASAVPGTTALRWMTRLESKGLIMRHADPFDARRVFVELSADGLLLMERYWVRMWAIGSN